MNVMGVPPSITETNTQNFFFALTKLKVQDSKVTREQIDRVDTYFISSTVQKIYPNLNFPPNQKHPFSKNL